MAHSNRKPRQPEDVAQCTCANLRRATRLVTQAYDRSLRPIGLRPTQFTILATLGRRGDMPLTKLANALVTDRTTLTRNLKPLIGQELVAIGHEGDQRVRLVALTKKGADKLEQARPLWRAAQERLVETLGEDQWSALLNGLGATVAALGDR